MWWGFAGAGVAAALIWSGTAVAQPSFYDVAADALHGEPGSILRVEAMTNVPAGAASAWRVIYRSRGIHNEPIAVSAVIAVPQGPAPAGGRAVVSWAHPTTGVARRCAPSLRADVFAHIPDLALLLANGAVVTATDYPGLGTAGAHPYMVGESQGRAVLDAVRAARNLPFANAGERFAAWGYSQGGHAVLFAAQLAKAYAPELRLLGVAAAAPPTELGSLLRADANEQSGKVLTAYALWSWSKTYRIALDTVLEERVRLVFERIVRDCDETTRNELGLWLAEQPLEREGFLKADITTTEPWATLIERNTPNPHRIHVPVFLAQGTADTTVRPKITELFADRLCAYRIPMELMWLPNASHTDAAKLSASRAIAWMLDRFAGRPAPTNCVAQ